MQIVVGDERVERGLCQTIAFAVVFDEECVCGAVEYQGFRPSVVKWEFVAGDGFVVLLSCEVMASTS